ncbi:MAG TPA: hypothetical protein VHS03_08105 [Gaiellaceae bacterium]|nr:hypothetical protein [Gaiellaceae bacterium]
MNLDVPIPSGAEERAHRVAMAAYGSHRPVPRRRSYWKPAVAIVVVAAVAGVLATPPGRSVISSIREAVGVKKAQRELFSLPAPGRLLVNSSSGPWVVQQDGSKRLLGKYTEASWSPFGRFVVAVRSRYELVTMEPNGKVHWTSAAPAVHLPSWGGTRTNTRIAYLSTPAWSVRGIAGDGTNGQNLTSCNAVAPVQPAWQPSSLHVLAVVEANGRVAVENTPSCEAVFRTASAFHPTKLQWSSDGKLLLAFAPTALRVYDLHGRVVAQDDPSDATRDVDATFLPGTHEVAVIRLHGASTSVFMLSSGMNLFSAGGLRQVVASPDGRWLLVTWPAADQWVFVRVAAPHTIRAYSQITRQFGRGTFPEVSGWIGH